LAEETFSFGEIEEGKLKAVAFNNCCGTDFNTGVTATAGFEKGFRGNGPWRSNFIMAAME
jgi:hypothetical protein